MQNSQLSFFLACALDPELRARSLVTGTVVVEAKKKNVLYELCLNTRFFYKKKVYKKMRLKSSKS